MLRMARDFNVRMDMLTPSQQVRRDIPLWYHRGFEKGWQKRYGSKTYQCLMAKHSVETAGDAMDVAARLDSPTHKKRENCGCTTCHADRTQSGCKNPHKCMVTAKIMLDRLTKKWDPRHPDQDDGLDLSPEDHQQNLEAIMNNEVIRFDPNIDRDCTLADGFKIFTSIWDTITVPLSSCAECWIFLICRLGSLPLCFVP
ncbi:hypothetical protein EDD18DRAFT_1072839 [Armillaria luteobubalina]|uniref:Uncharacterized protein n=1 Tax=Armillaria luteobubalina TaxID=153913 RepID=A0AA39UTU7_9AGAR|nr:hypothetical protein EDD18DRAFT_1072839 [Armillaria luteobubalina]